MINQCRMCVEEWLWRCSHVQVICVCNNIFHSFKLVKSLFEDQEQPCKSLIVMCCFVGEFLLNNVIKEIVFYIFFCLDI